MFTRFSAANFSPTAERYRTDYAVWLRLRPVVVAIVIAAVWGVVAWSAVPGDIVNALAPFAIITFFWVRYSPSSLGAVLFRRRDSLILDRDGAHIRIGRHDFAFEAEIISGFEIAPTSATSGFSLFPTTLYNAPAVQIRLVSGDLVAVPGLQRPRGARGRHGLKIQRIGERWAPSEGPLGQPLAFAAGSDEAITTFLLGRLDAIAGHHGPAYVPEPSNVTAVTTGPVSFRKPEAFDPRALTTGAAR